MNYCNQKLFPFYNSLSLDTEKIGDEPKRSEMTKDEDTNSEIVETIKAIPHLISIKEPVYKYTYKK